MDLFSSIKELFIKMFIVTVMQILIRSNVSQGIKSDITCTKVSGASPNTFYGLQAFCTHYAVAFLRISKIFH